MTAKLQWQLAFRQFRIAHNQVDIMHPNGITLRFQETSAIRKLTGKWDLPQPDNRRFARWQSTGRVKHVPESHRSLRLFLRS